MSDLEPVLRRLRTTQLPYKDRLAQRVADLVLAFADDYPEGRLSARALDALIDFLETKLSPGYPDLTATPMGDFYAEWRRSDHRRLAIEFMSSGDARYLIFGPNPRHPQRVDRFTGSTTADALGETITPLAHLAGLAA